MPAAAHVLPGLRIAGSCGLLACSNCAGLLRMQHLCGHEYTISAPRDDVCRPNALSCCKLIAGSSEMAGKVPTWLMQGPWLGRGAGANGPAPLSLHEEWLHRLRAKGEIGQEHGASRRWRLKEDGTLACPSHASPAA